MVWKARNFAFRTILIWLPPSKRFILSAMNNLSKFILISSRSRRIKLFNLFSAEFFLELHLLAASEKLYLLEEFQNLYMGWYFFILWHDIIEFTLRIFRHIKIRCTFVIKNFKSLPYIILSFSLLPYSISLTNAVINDICFTYYFFLNALRQHERGLGVSKFLQVLHKNLNLIQMNLVLQEKHL